MWIYRNTSFVKVAAQIEENLANRNVGFRAQFKAARRELCGSARDCLKWMVWNTCKRKSIKLSMT